jgi:hypothetical protein
VVPASSLSADGHVVQTDLTVQCPLCKAKFLGHYYFDHYDHAHDGKEAELLLDGFPRTTVQAEPVFFDSSDWADYEVPEDPYTVFLESSQQANALLGELGGPSKSFVNRMVFVQHISALEAYLGDTLINATMTTDGAIVRLVAADNVLKGQTVRLAKLVAEPDFVKTRARLYLQTVLYHDLRRVRELYVNALGIDMFDTLGENKKKLFKAIQLRHDCVHRNGRDKDGKLVSAFSRAYVQEVANMISDLVEEVEKQIPGKQSGTGRRQRGRRGRTQASSD